MLTHSKGGLRSAFCFFRRNSHHFIMFISQVFLFHVLHLEQRQGIAANHIWPGFPQSLAKPPFIIPALCRFFIGQVFR
ncbi:hypothetical protein HMPREF3213_03230 [Heyndrickxia coagulans]|uniref:Uncharacterized protein n=1 Tax=Heyndrickxia coagulans TaxID=1398 RepID=A0A133KE75_HEYCO|nr:hypothetical protein HMPREF3213_03230 [Heyndrickxia coagulans]